jgi:hypothetical protein
VNIFLPRLNPVIPCKYMHPYLHTYVCAQSTKRVSIWPSDEYLNSFLREKTIHTWYSILKSSIHCSALHTHVRVLTNIHFQAKSDYSFSPPTIIEGQMKLYFKNILSLTPYSRTTLCERDNINLLIGSLRLNVALLINSDSRYNKCVRWRSYLPPPSTDKLVFLREESVMRTAVVTLVCMCGCLFTRMFLVPIYLYSAAVCLITLFTQ